MKCSKVILFLAALIVLSCFYGCNAEKQVTERRNLMMPKKDELPRNSKYTGVKKRKTYKQKKRKHSKRRHLTYHYTAKHVTIIS